MITASKVFSTASVRNEDMAREEIRSLVQRHQELWNQHDPVGLTALFTDDADLVNVVGMHRRGKAEVFQEYDGIHRTFMRNSVLKIGELALDVLSSDFALGHLKWEMSGVEKLPGWNVPDIRRGVITYVFLRQNGDWKIRAFHNTDEIPVVPPKEMPRK